MDTNTLDFCIKKLQEGYTVEWTKSTQEDGVFTFPRPIYPDWLMKELTPMAIMYGYRTRMEELEKNNTPIEQYELRDVLAEATYIVRSERFNDGVIATYVSNGRLLKLLLRLREILNNKEKEEQLWDGK